MRIKVIKAHRLFRSGLLLLIVNGIGCSSPPDSSEGTPETSVLVPVRNTGAIHPSGYCGYTPLGRDDEGRELLEGEYYPYKEWNDLLAKDSALREATGFEKVSTCEEAREFSVLYYEAYKRSQLASAELTNTLPADLPTYLLNQTGETKQPKAEEDGDVQKILNGQVTSNSEVVQWLYLKDEEARKGTPLYKSFSSCTAVRIAGPLFLTAAHCIYPYVGPFGTPESYELNTIYMRYKDASGKHPFQGNCNAQRTDCNILSARAYIHPVYKGGLRGPDADIAVLYVVPRAQYSLRFQVPGAWGTSYSWIATQTPAPPDDLSVVGWGHLSVFGWGPSNLTEEKTHLPWEQRSFPNLAAIPIRPGGVQTFTKEEQVTEGGSTITKKFRTGTVSALADTPNALPAGSSPISVCKGDSGGPVFSPADTVVALIAQGEPTVATPQLCAQSGTAMLFARTDLVMDWLPAAVRKIQSGEGPLKPNTCKCAFVGPASDPTNAQNREAHITCAMGCSNASDLIVE